jgi:hypothetical protein
MRRITLFALAALLLPASSPGAESKQSRGRAGGGAGARAPAVRKAPVVPAPKPNQVDRLRNMTPQDRDRFLSKIPPERREKIERRLGELQKLPPAMVDRLRTRQEMLNSFAPPRQNQIKRSMQQFLNMPDDRRATLNQEIQRMAPLPDEERRAHMNTEEFRNRFTANEQQMMGNLVSITPGPQQQ